MNKVDTYLNLARKQPLPLSLGKIEKMIDNHKPTPNGKKLFNLKNLFIMMSSILTVLTTILIINFNVGNSEDVYVNIKSTEPVSGVTADRAAYKYTEQNTQKDQYKSKQYHSQFKTTTKNKVADKTNYKGGANLIAPELSAIWFSDGPRKRKNYNLEEYDIVIEKDTELSSANILSLYNHNGKIEIKTWDKPKVHIKAMIKVKASKTEKKIFTENIDLGLIEKDSLIKIVTNTVIPSKRSGVITSGKFGGTTNLFDRKEIEFENSEKAKIDELYIYYIITVPESFGLDLENNYDDVIIGDINGLVAVDLYQGDLDAENIRNDLQLYLSHGAANIKSCMSTNMDIHKSEVKITKCNEIVMDSKHSKFNIGSILKKLEIFSHKDSIIIGKVAHITGEINHGDLNAQHIDTANIVMHKTNFNSKTIHQINWYCTHSRLISERIKDINIQYSHKNKFSLSSVEKIYGETSHSDILIGEITGISNLTTFKGKVRIEKINPNAETLSFDSEHTDYILAGNNKYNFIIEHFKSEINLNNIDQKIKIKQNDGTKIIGDIDQTSPLLKISCHKGNIHLNI